MTPTPPALSAPSCTGNTAFATSLALLVLRLALGAVFIYHGGQKCWSWFGGNGLEGFAQFLATQNLPWFSALTWAWIAAGAEFFCGVAVLLGLLTRLASIPLLVDMLVAIAMIHGKNGFAGFHDPVKGLQPGYEFNLTLIAISLALLLTGPGLISLDAALFPRNLWCHGPQPLTPGK